MNPAALVQAIDGPKIVIPVGLAARLGLEAAAFLCQAAYLTAVCQETGGWFYLPMAGAADPCADSIFGRLGSWEAILGVSPKSQRAVRKKLVELGLLEERREGIPARLHYLVDLSKYLLFLSEIGPKTAPLSEVPKGHIKKLQKGTSSRDQSDQQDEPSRDIKMSPDGSSIYKSENQSENTHISDVCGDDVCIEFARRMSAGGIDNQGGLLKTLVPGWRGVITANDCQTVLTRGQALLDEVRVAPLKEAARRLEISHLRGEIETLKKIGMPDRIPGLMTQLHKLQIYSHKI